MFVFFQKEEENLLFRYWNKKRIYRKYFEKNREQVTVERQKESGRSGRALSPPLSYPQMNLSCCLIMFLSFFSPRGSQANFLHSGSAQLIGWHGGWPAIVCSEATGSFSSYAGSCSCFILTYTTLHFARIWKKETRTQIVCMLYIFACVGGLRLHVHACL